MSELPSLSVLDDELNYDPSTGIIRWNRAKQGRSADLIAGYELSTGYRRIHICGRSYQAGRIAFAMFHRRDISNGMEIDHVDGDPSNNAIINLREATRLQNSRNRRSTRGYSKIASRSRKNPFQVRIKYDGKIHNIGSFSTEEAARAAYEVAANKHFGYFSPSLAPELVKP